MNGVEVIAAIRADCPHARIIVLTTYKQDVQILRAVRAGAMGFLLKTMNRRELLETIRAVHAGQRKISAEVAIELADGSARDDLTPREIEVLGSVAQGKFQQNCSRLSFRHRRHSEGPYAQHSKQTWRE